MTPQNQNNGTLVSQNLEGKQPTVNEEIFALYSFTRNSRFLNIRKNIHTVEIAFIVAQNASYSKIANYNPSEIAHFHKSVKMYTRENIYIYSIFHQACTCSANSSAYILYGFYF